MLLIIIENSSEKNRLLGFAMVKKKLRRLPGGVASAVVSR